MSSTTSPKRLGIHRGPGRRRDEGFTLLETGITIFLCTVAMLALGRVVVGTTNSVDYIVRDSVGLQDIKDTVNGICQQLRQSRTSSITITSTTFSDTLTFSVNQDGTYGAEDQAGVFHAGWSIRYFVQSTDLVRQILDTGGATNSEQIVAQNIDNNDATKRCFTVTKNGNLYAVRIRLEDTYNDNRTIEKTMASTVHVGS